MDTMTDGGVSHANASRPKVEPISDRDRFIRRTLGLEYDPFLYSVAEQELGYAPNGFFASYTNSGTTQLDELLLRLSQPRHSLVLGPQGQGKTTLRLNLVRRLRESVPTILPVTCELTNLEAWNPHNPEPLAQQAIAVEISKDLLIALFDLFDPFAPIELAPASSLARVLRYLLRNSTYRRIIQRIAEAKDGVPLNSFWRTLGRPGLPTLSWSSPAVRTFAFEVQSLVAENVLGGDESHSSRMPAPGFDELTAAAATLGFAQLFLLIDSVDASVRTVQKVAGLLEPFAQLARHRPDKFYLKLFAPSEVWESLTNFHSGSSPLLRPLDVIDLQWTDQRLDAALLQRLRAAGSYIDVSTALFAGDDARRLHAELLADAAGSPRRLFHAISLIIDAHVGAGSQAPGLTYQDWKTSKLLTNHPASLH